jgi:predicted transport protein
MTEGYVYILLNRAFQNDYYKIGMTTKTPEERAKELSAATGVPRAFEVLYEQKVADCHRAERLLHQRLDRYRSTSNREFFQIPIKAAIKALEGVADEIGRIDDVEQFFIRPVPANDPASVAPPREISTGASLPKQSGRKPAGSVVTFEDHAAYTDAPRRAVLIELRSRVLSLAEQLRHGEQCTTSQRIRYKIPGGKIFLEVKVQRAAILLRLVDGGCPDPTEITSDIPESFGWGQLKKQITILTMADLDAAMPFIEAAYRASA